MRYLLFLPLLACPKPTPPADVLAVTEGTAAAAAVTTPTACTGAIDPAPAGFDASPDAPPAFAIGEPGKGALCEGQAYTVTAPVQVYRVYSASYETSKRAGPTGAYWSLTAPSGTSEGFRQAYAVCPEWNDLDMLAVCSVDVGALVVLGPGQSATCADGTVIPASAVNQLLVVRKADGRTPVSECVNSPQTWAK